MTPLARTKNHDLRHLATVVGRRLRKLRTEHGLTQREVAERVGVRPPVIARLERGTANPTLDVLLRAALAFDVSLSGLLRPD